MDFIDFIFSLIKRFVPMRDGKVAELEFRCRNQYSAYVLGHRIDMKGQPLPEGEEVPQPTGVAKMAVGFAKNWGENPWFQLSLAVGWIFSVRWVADFISDKDEDDEDDE